MCLQKCGPYELSTLTGQEQKTRLETESRFRNIVRGPNDWDRRASAQVSEKGSHSFEKYLRATEEGARSHENGRAIVTLVSFLLNISRKMW